MSQTEARIRRLELWAWGDREAPERLPSLEALGGSDWHPIVTAPKDGRSIMIWVKGAGVFASHCLAPISICNDDTWWDDSTGDRIEPIEGATHWMPLPTPPEPTPPTNTEGRETP